MLRPGLGLGHCLFKIVSCECIMLENVTMVIQHVVSFVVFCVYVFFNFWFCYCFNFFS